MDGWMDDFSHSISHNKGWWMHRVYKIHLKEYMSLFLLECDDDVTKTGVSMMSSSHSNKNKHEIEVFSAGEAPVFQSSMCRPTMTDIASPDCQTICATEDRHTNSTSHLCAYSP